MRRVRNSPIPQNTLMSLPLMRKTFIEALSGRRLVRLSGRWSLPLMRKTFIEAALWQYLNAGKAAVSSAYAEDFH